MFRLLVLVNLFILNLLACQGGYDSCLQKVKDSQSVKNSSLFVPVKNHKLLIYSKHQPKLKILKHDSFLSLYLVEDKKKFAYPFDINMNLNLGTAMVNAKKARSGKIVRNQIGLNNLARYNKKLLTPSLLTSGCCNLEGIVTSKGIIQKEYIKRFISSASSEYADIGVRVKNEGGYVIVSESNPFLKINPLKKEDCILAFDGKNIRAASVFMRRVLFSKVGSKHTIKIKRHNKILNLKVISYKRYGGGNFSDTFLEQKSIYFNKTLHVIKFSKHSIHYGLMLGDKLLQVNGKKVKTQSEVRKYIEDFKDFSSLLFERRKFQFFVDIK